MKRKYSTAAADAKEKFNEYIVPNIGCLYKMLCAYMGSFEAAQDVLQESLIKAYRHIDTLIEPEKAYSWVYVIARNEAKRYFQKNPKEVEITEYTANQNDESFCTIEQKQDISKLLMQLTQEEREMVILKDMMEYSYAEIAKMLNLSATNVGARLSRAREKLRKIIRENGYVKGEKDLEVQ